MSEDRDEDRVDPRDIRFPPDDEDRRREDAQTVAEWASIIQRRAQALTAMALEALRRDEENERRGQGREGG